MKKQLLLTVAYLFFFSISGWGQHTIWKLNLKSNYSIVDIENNNYYFFPIIANDPLDINGFGDINRNGKGQPGLEFGIQAKIKFSERINIISGLEAKFIRFNRVEELDESSSDLKNLFTTLGSYVIAGQPYGVIQGEYIVRDVSGNQVETLKEFKIQEGEFQQKLLYLNIPLNIGYSTKADCWTFYGGLWYSRLISSRFENYERYNVNHDNDLFNKNIIGYNFGVDVNIFPRIGLTTSYSGVVSNIYGQEKQGFSGSTGVQIISLGFSFKLK